MQMLGGISFDIYSVAAIIIISILCINIKATIKIAIWAWNKTSNYEFLWKALLYVIPVAGAAGVIIPTLFGMINLTMLGIYLAIPMISAPLIYYFVFLRCPDQEVEDPAGV